MTGLEEEEEAAEKEQGLREAADPAREKAVRAKEMKARLGREEAAAAAEDQRRERVEGKQIGSLGRLAREAYDLVVAARDKAATESGSWAALNYLRGTILCAQSDEIPQEVLKVWTSSDSEEQKVATLEETGLSSYINVKRCALFRSHRWLPADFAPSPRSQVSQYSYVLSHLRLHSLLLLLKSRRSRNIPETSACFRSPALSASSSTARYSSALSSTRQIPLLGKSNPLGAISGNIWNGSTTKIVRERGSPSTYCKPAISCLMDSVLATIP